MELNKALEGLIISRSAEGASPHTIQVYRYGIRKLSDFLMNPDLESIHKEDIQKFLVHLRKDTSLAESSLINIRRGISVLFNWVEKEFDLKRPDLGISYPKAPEKEVKPFSSDEIRRLLSACNYSKESKTKERNSFMMKRPTSNRDKTIILVLLDTGLRVSELARLQLKDIDFETGEIRVQPFGSGLKSKSRSVFIGKLSKSTLWRFLSGKYLQPEEYIFTTIQGLLMNRTSIRQLLKRIGSRAEVLEVYPHRFRHTFAIQYLRNGGDIFTLQRILGHSSLEMVKRYLAIAKADCETAHRKASPVDNWKLY
jgi:integrase/recombinase XerD